MSNSLLSKLSREDVHAFSATERSLSGEGVQRALHADPEIVSPGVV